MDFQNSRLAEPSKNHCNITNKLGTFNKENKTVSRVIHSPIF